MAKNDAPRSTPFEFMQDVRNEAKKVTWPSRKETMITTGLVLLMAVVASIFFLLSDKLIAFFVASVLGFGG